VTLTVQYELIQGLLQTKRKSGISLHPKRQLLTLLLPAVFHWITSNWVKKCKLPLQ